MKRTLKRAFSLVLALALFLTILPSFTLVARAEASSGACGDNLSWTFDPDTGVLTIEGSGAMTDWFFSKDVPWLQFREAITEISLPEGLTSIGESAFEQCSSLSSVSIPDSVRIIRTAAFSDCRGLRSVSLPDGLTAIDDYVFYDCSSLRSVTIPDSVTNIAWHTFSNCSSLETVSLSGSLTTIEPCLFENCTSLSSVTIPEGVYRIDWSAFEGCSSLCSVSIPDSVLYIEARAFAGCTALEQITIPIGVEAICQDAFIGCSSLGAVMFLTPDCGIGETAETLGGTWITNLYGYDNSTAEQYAQQFGYNFRSLGAYVSGNCGANGNNLTWTFYPDIGLLTISGSGNMRNYPHSTASPWYQYREVITKVSFPKGLKSIGDYSFYGCSALGSMTIPDGVTSIGDYSFYGCSALRSMTIHDGVTSIGKYAFYNCSSLYPLILPDSLNDIGNLAFGLCASLGSVTIPASVSSIGSDAFVNGSGLKSLVIMNPSCEIAPSPNTLGDSMYVILYGYQNSTTQEYAKNRCYTFRPLDRFADVKPTIWYAVPVAWAVGRGITNGTGESSFSPNQTCTREQVVSFLWKANRSPKPGGTDNPFTDVKPGKYYYSPVLWAYYHQPRITSGAAPGRFGVGQTCNRAQVVTLLWNAAGQPEPSANGNPFTDVKETDYFYKAVLWAVEKGITSGTAPTSFSPGKVCTRAEVVTFLYKAYAG